MFERQTNRSRSARARHLTLIAWSRHAALLAGLLAVALLPRPSLAEDDPSDDEPTAQNEASEHEEHTGSTGHGEKGRPSPSAERLLDEAGAIAEQVAQIRGLTPTRKIAKGVKNREELRKILIEKLAEEQTKEQIRHEAAVLRKLGLIPQDLDYRETILDVLTEQIAGFYDQKKEQLNIMVGIPLDLQRPAIAHEIFHAIQDQHFDLTRMLEPFDARENGDFELARSALIEGDASVLMIDYSLYRDGTLPRKWYRSLVDIKMMATALKQLDYQKLGAIEQLQGDKADEKSTKSKEKASGPTDLFASSLSSAPPIIRRVLIFPYLAGMRFVISMRSGRTWKEFNDVYRNPPVSTEQILHPERYANRDEPVVLEYDPSPVLEGYEPIYDTVLGEFQMRLFLEEHTDQPAKTDSESSKERLQTIEQASTGWDGDRLLAFEDDAGHITLTHLSVWDSRKDAEEYYEALVEVNARRFPEASTHTASGKYGASTCLHTKRNDRGERVYVERWGDAVLHIEGAPSELDRDGHETNPTTYLLREQTWRSLDRVPFREVYETRMQEKTASERADTQSKSTPEKERR